MTNELIETPTRAIPTLVKGSAEDDNLNVTEKAVEKIKEILAANQIEPDYKIRLGTQNHGCSGIGYTMAFDNVISENDRVFDVDTFSFVVDNKNIFYLMGITVDYIDDASGQGFIFDNPYREQTCGCSMNPYDA